MGDIAIGVSQRATQLAHPNMVFIPGGTFRMGSDKHYPEEAPAHRVTVDGFWIDRTPVTNLQFRKFVNESGYVTFAETVPDKKDYPNALPHLLFAGSLVFTPPARVANLRDWSQWWTLMKGANWRHPYGPKSSINHLDNHPVVHVSCSDAHAYAKWAAKDLPTEAEWEYAARGGLEGAEFAWGDEFTPSGKHMANTWQGNFPQANTCEDGFERTSPVRSFPLNGYGIYDMIGNVWEWTSDWYSQSTKRMCRRRAAFQKIPAAAARSTATTRASRISKSRARSSRVARICAHRTTAAAIGRRRATQNRSIRPRATLASVASSERGMRHER